MKLLAVRRLFRILRVVIRYRLDDLLFALPLPFWLRALGAALPWRWLPRPAQHESRGACLRLALDTTAPGGKVLCTVWLGGDGAPLYAEFSQDSRVVLTARLLSFTSE